MVFNATQALPIIDGRVDVNSVLRFDTNSPVDAFGRLIVAQPFTLFDSKQLYDSLPDFYYDISRTNVNTLSGGALIASGYASNNVPVVNLNIDSTLTLGATINDPGLTVTRDELVFSVQNINAGSESYITSLTYREEL